MSITLNPTILNYKDPVTGNYVDLGAIIASGGNSTISGSTDESINSIDIADYNTLTWEVNGYDTDGVTIITATNRLIIKEYLNLDLIQHIITPTGWGMYYYIFDTNKTLIGKTAQWRQTTTPMTPENLRSTYAAAKYIHILFRKNDNSNLTLSDASAITISYKSIVTKQTVDILKNGKYNLASMPVFIHNTSNQIQGLVKIKNKFLQFTSGADDHTSYLGKIYSITENFANHQIFYHNLGHCSTLFYNEFTDVLFVSNFILNNVGSIVMFKNASTATNLYYTDSNCLMIQLPFVTSRSFSVIQGDAWNTIYLLWNNTLYHCLLGTGNNVLEGDTIYGTRINVDSEFEFNGTLKVLNTIPFNIDSTRTRQNIIHYRNGFLVLSGTQDTQLDYYSLVDNVIVSRETYYVNNYNYTNGSNYQLEPEGIIYDNGKIYVSLWDNGGSNGARFIIQLLNAAEYNQNDSNGNSNNSGNDSNNSSTKTVSEEVTVTNKIINIPTSNVETINSLSLVTPTNSDVTLMVSNQNLFTKDGDPQTKNGLTYTCVRDSNQRILYLEIDGTASSYTYNYLAKMKFLANIHYYISGGESATDHFRLMLTSTSGGGTVKIAIPATGYDFCPEEDVQYYLNTYVSEGTVCDHLRLYPQVTIGTQLKEYIPGQIQQITLPAKADGVYTTSDLTQLQLFNPETNLWIISNDSYTDFTLSYQTLVTVQEDTASQIDYISSTADTYALTTAIPSYFLDDTTAQTTYLSDKIADVKAIKADDRFIFWTDPHWLWNAKHSAEIVGYAKNKLKIDKLICGGDILGNGGTSTRAEGLYLLKQFSNKVQDIFYKGYYYTLGDHDLNQSGGVPQGMSSEEFASRALTFEEVYNNCIAPYADDGRVFTDNPQYNSSTQYYYWNRLHYYFDNSEEKIRYIVLCSGTPHNPLQSLVSFNVNELYKQLPWLYDVLIHTPNGYGVVLIAHKFVDDPETLALNPPSQSIAKMLVALQNHTSCTVQSGRSSSTTTTFDFSTATCEPICMICGHKHVDFSIVWTGYDSNASLEIGVDASGSNSIPVIVTRCDTRHNKDDMPVGTINEQAFDIVSINRSQRKINLTRIGVGEDREFVY